MEDLNSESDLDMTEVWPPVPPATCEAPAAESGAGVGGGGAEGNPPTPSVSPGRADFHGINASSDNINSKWAGTFPRLWGDLRETWRFLASAPNCKSDARGPSRGV